VLESLFHWARQYAIQGDVGKWSNARIADGIGWKGDPGKLIDMLIAAGFLDVHDDENVRLTIHDIEKHADNQWKQNLDDAGLKWWNGKRPRSGKSGRPKKISKTEKTSRKPPNNLQNLEVKPPKPEPEPEPEPNPKPKPTHSAPVGDVEALPSNLQTTEFNDAWAAWEKHRAEIRKPLKPTMRAEQLKQLAAWGPTKAVLSLRKSIQNGWQGIFEPDQKPGATAASPPPLIGQKSDPYERVRQRQLEEAKKEYLAKQRKHESEPKLIGGLPI
jgi:hypothetical protein